MILIFSAAVEQAVHDALEKSSVASFCIKEFSEWAMSETDAVTLGSALRFCVAKLFASGGLEKDYQK